jgi:hypothetical protein
MRCDHPTLTRVWFGGLESGSRNILQKLWMRSSLKKIRDHLSLTPNQTAPKRTFGLINKLVYCFSRSSFFGFSLCNKIS